MKNLWLLIFVLLLLNASAQVPKKVLVEHFTNSHCSVCAAQNPGFHANLANHPQVLCLGVHPSSPYQACIFSQHLQPGNDDRANYYGVYGATPRFVLQGEVKSNVGTGNASFFTPYLNQQSPLSIKITQKKYGADSIRVRVVIKSVVNHTLSNLRFYMALAEDTVFYTSPNGETKHFNVLRKNLSPGSGELISLGQTAGDSLVREALSVSHAAWNSSRIYAIALVQETDKKMVQAEASKASEGYVMSLPKTNSQDIRVFTSETNPGVVTVKIGELTDNASIQIFDLSGRLVTQRQIAFANEEIQLSPARAGFYFYVLNYKGEQYKGKLAIAD